MSVTPKLKLIVTADLGGRLRLSNGLDVNETLKQLGVIDDEDLIKTYETEYAALIQTLCKYHFSIYAYSNIHRSEQFRMDESELLTFIEITLQQIAEDDTGHCVPRWLSKFITSKEEGTKAHSKLWYV